MVSLIPIPTQFARNYNFYLCLSSPATPCNIFVLNPRKGLHFRRKIGGFDRVLGKKMCSLKFLQLRREKDEHCVCCCGEESQSEADMKLEAEILAFVEKLENPDAFPTRKDLEKAGRVDLIEAIMNRGGWYSFGWDSEVETTDPENVHKTEAEEMDFDIEELRRRVEKFQESDSLRGNEDSDSGFSFGNSSQPASSSGRSLEAVVEEDSGIQGILSRLEKERISSLDINTNKYGYGANHSCRDNIDDRSSGTTTTTDRIDLGKNGSLTTCNPKKGGLSDSGGQLNRKYMSDMWRAWSIQRACPEGTEFEEKLLEEKQKRIDGATKALQFLCTTRIVWHNSASEVLLKGSFDGWTTQRKMEKLCTGIFSVSLKLYPGSYEIKFIVDGIWKVDPLRPVVHKNGHANNLLIVT